MNLLLDTHALLWWMADDTALKAEAREAIGEASSMIYVSAASAWEISIKKALGKLDAPDDLHAHLLPITSNHYRSRLTTPSALDNCHVTTTIHSIEC